MRKFFIILLMVEVSVCQQGGIRYPWLDREGEQACIMSEIKSPVGYQRINTVAGSFDDWLRHLPLKAIGTPVLHYDGAPKPNQNAHIAVIDIDTGPFDLQQCADAVIRLRAEYLFSIKAFSFIHFNFTNGEKAPFVRWIDGARPRVNGNKVMWMNTTKRDTSYSNFRAYLTKIFTYAGSHSLSLELKKRKNASEMQIGDVFIQGGFPGHAIIIVDLAMNPDTNEKAFLLAQSYMPAQDMHILKNPLDEDISPWYKIPSDVWLQTPEWTFKKTDLKYFDLSQ